MVAFDELEIFRDDDSLAIVKIDEKTEFVENFMADCGLTMDVIVNAPLPIQLDDYVLHDGEHFSIYEAPQMDKINQDTYRYVSRFESPLFILYSEYIKHLGDIEFSFLGTARDHLQLLIDSAHDIDIDFAIGEVEETDPINITYSSAYCREALNLIAKTFGLEYKCKNKVINLIKHIGTVLPITLKYGRNNGLCSLSRKSVDNSGVVNRVYGFGGSKNIDYTYRNGAKRLVFESRRLDAVTPFKIRAGKYENEDIFPKRTGTLTDVTELDESQTFTITDSSLDFDINDCLLEGLTAKVSFKTGELAGNDFEIKSYDNVTKVITLIAFKDTTDYVLPNAVFKAAVGNKYVLIDLKMPQIEIDNAEAELQAKSQQYLDENKIPKVIYDLNAIDEKFIRTNGITISVGDEATIADDDLEINHLMRFTGIRYPKVNPAAVKAIISNFLYYTVDQKITETVLETQKEVKINTKVNAEKARLNSKELNLLTSRVFDPDGNLAGGALSIIAAMAKFGFDSQNFGLLSTKIISNAGGDANKLTISAGSLVHYIYKIAGVGYQWEMEANEFAGLNPAKYYYVYAKCSKSTLTGTWEVSETPVTVDQFNGYWVFNLGQVFEVNEDGYRSVRFTKGITFIVGNEITTGIIKSISGQNYFNLDEGTFNLGDLISGLDFGVTTPNRLTIRGGIVQNAGGITAPIGIYRGDWAYAITYYKGDEVSYDGSLYVMKNDLSITNILPTNAAYWRLKISKGTNGTNGAPGTNGTNGTNGQFTEVRFAKTGSPTVAPSLVNTDYTPTGWAVTEPTLDPLQYMYRITAVKQNGALVSNWSSPQRFTPVDGINGSNGTNGANGVRGPFPAGRGVWSNVIGYKGTADRIEIVKYGGDWYWTRTDAGSIPVGTLPTNAAYFNPYGGQFESIATGLLFAELAYIENLGVKYVRTSDTGARIEVNRSNGNNLELFDLTEKRIVNIDDDNAVDGDTVYTGTIPIYDFEGTPLFFRQSGSTYYYRSREAGVSVGYGIKDAGGFSSMSRTKIFTNGSIEASNIDGTTSMKLTSEGLTLRQAGFDVPLVTGVFPYEWLGTTYYKKYMRGVLVEQGLGTGT